jgi:hypothetical protein
MHMVGQSIQRLVPPEEEPGVGPDVSGTPLVKDGLRI